jgi:septal ring factor EnvC (AmiA/AmiB activator)
MPVKQPKKAGTLEPNAPQLYLEVWRQEQTINPETVLKEKKKES